jgi:hypothetical protein
LVMRSAGKSYCETRMGKRRNSQQILGGKIEAKRKLGRFTLPFLRKYARRIKRFTLLFLQKHARRIGRYTLPFLRKYARRIGRFTLPFLRKYARRIGRFTLTFLRKYARIYTGCPRRNVPDFGRVFLMIKYTDITQNTYIQS